MYRLRQLQRQQQQPIAHQDVTLFPAIQQILKQLQSPHTSTQFAHTKFAIASRTKSVAWAHNLLHQFGLESLFEYIEIFPGTLQCFDKRGRTSCRNSTRAIELSCPSRSFYCVDTYLSRPSFFPSFFSIQKKPILVLLHYHKCCFYAYPLILVHIPLFSPFIFINQGIKNNIFKNYTKPPESRIAI